MATLASPPSSVADSPQAAPAGRMRARAHPWPVEQGVTQLSDTELTFADRVMPGLVSAVLLGAAVMVLGAAGSLLLRAPHSDTATWWPASGLGFAVLVRARNELRPYLLAGIFLGVSGGNLLANGTPVAAVFFGAASAVEGGVASYLLTRGHNASSATAVLTRLKDGVRLLLSVSVAVALAAGLILLRCVVLGSANATSVVVGYVISHALGVLLLVPLLLAPVDLRAWRELAREGWRNVEWAVLLAVSVAAVLVGFRVGAAAPTTVVLLPLLLTAARVGPLRTMLSVLAVAMIDTVGTSRGLWTAAAESAPQWRLQAFLGTMSVLCLLLVLNDTSRRAALAVMAGSVERFRAAFDASPVGMWVGGLDAKPGIILRANPALCSLLGYSPEELVGRSEDLFVEPADAAVARDRLAAMRAGALPSYARECWLRRKDGRLVPTYQTVAVVRAGRAPAQVIAQVHDVSETKAAESALLDALERQQQLATRLRRADAERAEVVATVSHELRTPLTVVRGALDALSSPDAGPDAARAVTLASRNTEDALGLVDELLALLDLQRDVGTGEPAPVVDVAELVRAEARALEPAITQARHRVQLVGLAEPLPVAGDADELSRVVRNVLVNAVKFTLPGGRITVTGRATQSEVAVDVEDTGIGIDPDDLDDLGTRFFRARTARALNINGGGLGLALAQQVLTRHNGRLAVASTPGRGSRFTLSLPRSAGGAPRR